MAPPPARDALSDVLRALRLSGGMFFQVALRPPFAVWSMEHEALRAHYGAGADHVLPFHMVTAGRIWFETRGHAPVALEAGDLIALPRGTPHALTDRPGRSPVPVAQLEDQVRGYPPTLHHGGDGEEARALCGFFRCSGRLFNPLLEALPEQLVVRRDPARTPWVWSTLQRAFLSGLDDEPGAAALVERLTELLFVDVVQAHLRQAPAAGWLAGLADPLVGRALAELHAAPAHPWTVEELARRVGRSRSALADRFRELVGMSVIKYLTAWRMELASQQLLTTQHSVAEVAHAVGYTSEAALNRAFKRHVGEPPATWRRARSPGDR